MKGKKVTPKKSKKFLDASYSDIAPYVEKNWVDSIDYKTLSDDSQVLIFADTDHRQTGISGGLAKHMGKLKNAGFTHFCIEMPRSQEYMDAVNNLNETGDLSGILDLAEKTRTPTRIAKMLKNAKDAALEVYLIDMPHNEMDSKWSEEERSENRGRYMGQKISELVENKGAKVAAFVGYGHLEENQIPGELKKKGIKHKKVAAVTAGQPASIPLNIDTGLFLMGAVAAIRNNNLNEKCGYTGLDGNFDVDGFMYFPKVSLIEDIVKNKLAISNGNAITANQNGGVQDEFSLAFTKDSLPAIQYDFRTEVEPSCDHWEQTNKQKIFKLMGNINKLADGQKFYLSFMLENYVRTTMRHGGGSILNIEFEPETQAFGIDTVDTFGYKFNPNADYAGLARHREVTLDTLLTHFGFKDIVIKNIQDIPKTDIRPNPDKPDSAVNLILMLSAYATNPERLKVCSDELRILRNKNNREDYIASIKIDDFELNELEDALLNFTKNTGMECYNYGGALYRCIWDAQDKKSNKHKDVLDEVYKILDNSSPFHMHDYSNVAEKELLKARKNLQFIEKKPATEIMQGIEGKLEDYKQALNKMDEIACKYPWLYDSKTSSKISTDEMKFKDLIKKNLDNCAKYAKEIDRIKFLVSTYDVVNQNGQNYLADKVVSQNS